VKKMVDSPPNLGQSLGVLERGGKEHILLGEEEEHDEEER
jgi:hypothetical protein